MTTIKDLINDYGKDCYELGKTIGSRGLPNDDENTMESALDDLTEQIKERIVG